MTMTVEQMALDERKFLHDISNHLVVAQGMGSIALRNVEKMDGIDPKTVERLAKSVKAVDEMIRLVKARRIVLHQHSS